MRAYVGVTDWDWYQFLRARGATEVNFWQPSGGRRFAAIPQGAPFLFQTHYSHGNRIASGGLLSGWACLPMARAWEFFDSDAAPPAPPGWSGNIVQGRSYDLASDEGSYLEQVLTTLLFNHAVEPNAADEGQAPSSIPNVLYEGVVGMRRSDPAGGLHTVGGVVMAGGTPAVQVTVPAMGLVVLVGVSGSGKSAFARTHFRPTEVVSSDLCRGLVADEEDDQSATADAFELLHYIVGTRLRRGLLTVVDATNVQQTARASLVKLARSHDVLVDAIVIDVPESVAVERNRHRPDRDFGSHVVSRQHRDLRRSLPRLNREGFRRVHLLRGDDQSQTVEVVRERPWNDRTDLTGPFDVIGDVHGCAAELKSLLIELGWKIEYDGQVAVDASPPEGRQALFVGDLVDRGPHTPAVLRLVMGMVASGKALCVSGNHEAKLVRALKGSKVSVSHGLAESLTQLAAEPEDFRRRAVEFMDALISHYVLDGGRLVVAHAGLKESYHGRSSGRVRSFALYGDTTGETDEYGLPVRYPWAQDYRGRAMVVYGHTPVPRAEWVNNTICLDTGAVFGGALTALRYPERQIVSVPAERQWHEPVRPLAGPAPGR